MNDSIRAPAPEADTRDDIDTGADLDTDVLIIGAGPTGLMLANQLGRRGVRTLIVDRHAGPARETRALGVQARTLEIYAALGVVDRALELGKPATGANLWADGRRTARVPLGDAGRQLSPYPYILVLGQDDNEHILGERLPDWGLAVQWNCELLGLEQSASHVTATLQQADGSTRSVRAAWVAGCDGAHSAVRRLSGIDFPGAPYEHVFFVADVQMTGTMVPDEVNVYLWQAGFHLLFPMRGQDHWRIVGILPPERRDRAEGLRFDDVLPALRAQAGDALDIRDCSWFSTYRIHHRAAARFRDRRCFLLGDAAHIHSPVGAQGMNTGLQDAYNLGWKLALVAAQRADAALLDAYETERMPVAQRLLATTDRAFKVVVSEGRMAGLLRTRVLARVAALVMGSPRVQALAFRTVSQIGIHYRESALSVQPAAWPGDAPQAGDRFPWLHLRFEPSGPVADLFQRLDDTRFNLLVFDASAGAESVEAGPAFGDLLCVHHVSQDADNDAELARHRIVQPAFFLLRPDGYIGCCGTRLDAGELARYAAEGLDLLAPAPIAGGYPADPP